MLDQDSQVSHLYFNMLARHLDQLDLSPTTRPRLPDTLSGFSRRYSIRELTQALADASEVTRNSAIGLTLGRAVHPSDYGVLGYALMNAPTLLAGMETVIRYKSLMNSSFTASLETQGDLIAYQLTLSSAHNTHLLELDFASALQLGRYMISDREKASLRPEKVLFQHPPQTDRRIYEACFQCPVLFNQPENQIIMRRKLMLKPVHAADPFLFRMFEKKLQRQLHKVCHQRRLSEEIKHYLKRNLEHSPPSAADAARDFNMSVSSLKKHLQKEGANYTTLCDEVRLHVAKGLVAQGDISLKQVGCKVGYADASTFHRAFKRWTGVSPSAFRKQHAPFAEAYPL